MSKLYSFGSKLHENEIYILAGTKDYKGDLYYMIKEETLNNLTNNNMKKENRFPFELKPSDASRIINIACNTWKGKLAKKWGEAIVLNNSIEISESEYKTMRSACDISQNNLFDDIFGKDIEEVYYTTGQRFSLKDEIYILSQTDNNIVCFISLRDGNRYRNPILINDSGNITKSELDKLGQNFILIED